MKIHSVSETWAEGRRDKRQAVLDAALAAFAERTYTATTMPLVAERAGTGVGTIYRYFPHKEALGNAVFQQAKGTMLDYLTVGGEGGSVRAKFGAMWRGLAAFANKHPDSFTFLEHQQHDHYLDDDSLALAAQTDAVAIDFIQRAQAVGAIRRNVDAALLVALVLGAFTGLAKTARAAGRALSEAEIAAGEAAAWDLLHGSK